MKPAPAAMVLAAGLGERMRPLSAHRAKPTLPVLGRSLVGRILHHLAGQGVTRCGVNAFHAAESVADTLEREAPRGASVALFREGERMDTGGALDAPRALLAEQDAFLIHNGDTLAETPLAALVAALDDERAIGALLVRPRRSPGYAALGVRDGHVHALRAGEGDEAATYLGVSLYRSALLERVPRGRPSSLFVDVVLPALAEGARLPVVAYEGPWLEFTSPHSYHQTLLGLLESASGAKSLPLPGGAVALDPRHAQPCFCDAEASLDPCARVEGSVVLERGAEVGTGSQLARVVALEGAQVAEGATLRNVLLAPETTVPRDAQYADGLLETLPSGALRFTPWAEGTP